MELARLLNDLLHCTRNAMTHFPRITAHAAMAVSSLFLGLSSHQPADHTHVKSPRPEKWRDKVVNFGASKITQSLRGITSRTRLENGSRRVRQERSSITATSTCQEYVRQSHALAAFHPITARRSSVAFPCLCRFEKTFVIPSHFCRNSEHARMNTLGWNSVSLFKHHTSNDTLFESNEHVSGRHNDNEAVRLRHRTCSRCKTEPNIPSSTV